MVIILIPLAKVIHQRRFHILHTLLNASYLIVAAPHVTGAVASCSSTVLCRSRNILQSVRRVFVTTLVHVTRMEIVYVRERILGHIAIR